MYQSIFNANATIYVLKSNANATIYVLKSNANATVYELKSNANAAAFSSKSFISRSLERYVPTTFRQICCILWKAALI